MRDVKVDFSSRSLIASESTRYHRLLFRRQELGLRREIVDVAEREESSDDGHDSFDDEDPSLAVQSVSKVSLWMCTIASQLTHPPNPPSPSIFPIANARRPPNAPESVTAEKKSEIRMFCSRRSVNENVNRGNLKMDS